MRTVPGFSLLEYVAPEDWSDQNGIVLPSQATMRDYLRDAGSKNFTADTIPPDVYRWGRFISGELPVPIGAFVYYNKHDADEFEVEQKKYVRINDLNALAYYVKGNGTEASDQVDA